MSGVCGWCYQAEFRATLQMNYSKNYSCPMKKHRTYTLLEIMRHSFRDNRLN